MFDFLLLLFDIELIQYLFYKFLFLVRNKYNYYYQSTQYANIGSGETGTAFTGVDASCIDGYSVRTNFKLCDFAGNCAYKENAIFSYSGKGTVCKR